MYSKSAIYRDPDCGCGGCGGGGGCCNHVEPIIREFRGGVNPCMPSTCSPIPYQPTQQQQRHFYPSQMHCTAEPAIRIECRKSLPMECIEIQTAPPPPLPQQQQMQQTSCRSRCGSPQPQQCRSRCGSPIQMQTMPIQCMQKPVYYSEIPQAQLVADCRQSRFNSSLLLFNYDTINL